jgi:hypothetical protein
MSELDITVKEIDKYFENILFYSPSFSIAKIIFLTFKIFIIIESLSIHEREFIINHLKTKYNG